MNTSVIEGVRRGTCLGAAALVLTAIFWVVPGGVRAEWWLYPPAGYQKIGGATKIGPYPSRQDAERINQEYFNGQGKIEGEDPPPPPPPPSSFYGVVTIYNRTGGAIPFAIRSTSDGDWIKDTIAPNGGWYYRYQRLPADFALAYDTSYLPGEQTRRYSLKYNLFGEIHGKPGCTDGRAYELYVKDDGETIGLRVAEVEGSADHDKPAPLDNTIDSIVGHGTGTADSVDHPADASGTFTLQATTPVGMEVAGGTWKARRLDSGGNWEFTLQVDDREAVATAVVLHGGVGTTNDFPIAFPCRRGPDQRVRIRFEVQFSGDRVRLLTFTKAD